MQKEIEEEQYDAGVSYWQNNGEKIYGNSHHTQRSSETFVSRLTCFA
jgi:hypothetical protein